MIGVLCGAGWVGIVAVALVIITLIVTVGVLADAVHHRYHERKKMEIEQKHEVTQAVHDGGDDP